MERGHTDKFKNNETTTFIHQDIILIQNKKWFKIVSSVLSRAHSLKEVIKVLINTEDALDWLLISFEVLAYFTVI